MVCCTKRGGVAGTDAEHDCESDDLGRSNATQPDRVGNGNASAVGGTGF